MISHFHSALKIYSEISWVSRSRQDLPGRVAVGARRGHQTSVTVPVSCSVTAEAATPTGDLWGRKSLPWDGAFFVQSYSAWVQCLCLWIMLKLQHLEFGEACLRGFWGWVFIGVDFREGCCVGVDFGDGCLYMEEWSKCETFKGI